MITNNKRNINKKKGKLVYLHMNKTIQTKYNTWDLQYQSNDMMWPSEMLIRMFKGTRMPRCNFDKTKYMYQSIIDIGCGDCNNFPLYKQLGFRRICGVEITEK